MTVENTTNAARRSSDEHARRHLLLSFPELESSQSGTEAVDSLVEGATHSLLFERGTSTLVSVIDLSRRIKEMTGLHYSTDELISALERLESKRRLEFRHSQKRAFRFSEDRFRELSGDLEYRRERMASVQKEWADDVRIRHQLSDSDADALWTAFDRFLAATVSTYAAEAAGFLYLAEEGGAERFGDVLDQRLPQITEYVDGRLIPVARAEYPKFFDVRNGARTDYIAHRLRAAFVYHLLTIDPSASELARTGVADKEFYLDTNFIIRLFGFDGPTLAYGPLAFVELAEQLNCRLVVAEETIHEFIRTVRAEGAQLRRQGVNHAAYRRLIAQHPGDEFNFSTAFYRELESGQVRDVDGFERKYVNADKILKEYGIDIDHAAQITEADRIDSAFLDLASAIRTWSNGKKPIEAGEHDAFMLRLIRGKRGKREKSPASVGCWFLTYDRSVTSYSVRKHPPGCMPEGMLVGDWMQIARPFVPRTENFDMSFVAMLRHPLVFDDPNLVPLTSMMTALRRLEEVKDLPLPLVAAMVADREIVRRIEMSKGPEKLRELLEVQSATYASQLEKKQQRTAYEAEEQRALAAQFERSSQEHRQRHADAQAALQRTKTGLETATRALVDQRAQAEEDRELAVQTATAEAAERTRNLLAEQKAASDFASEKRAEAAANRAVADYKRRLKGVTLLLVTLLLVAGAFIFLPYLRTVENYTIAVSWSVVVFISIRGIVRRRTADETRAELADWLAIIGFLTVSVIAISKAIWMDPVALPATPTPASSSPRAVQSSPSGAQDPAGPKAADTDRARRD